jgi:hypothetical protein
MNSKYKSDIKAWLRKYPTPKQQQKHPFETFVKKKLFRNTERLNEKFLTEYNIKMHTNSQAGNLTVSHYMTLLQKLTSIINYDLMKICFNLPENYDFVLDPSHKKKKNAQKEYKAYLIQDMGNEQTPITIYLNENSYRLANYVNLNKLDDPKATQKDKAVDIAKSVAAIAGLIPNPVIGPASNLVVETASYLIDLQRRKT